MTAALVLVLFIIGVELYRPIIIGNAIDQYINGTYADMLNAPEGTYSLDQMEIVKNECFSGILHAAFLYAIMLILGFVLNALDSWILQKMGQKIVYTLREETFAHIHSLSLSFFNTTPVGKLVTRVSNDTEAVNELFTSILVKLFKNSIKIIGYAVVMLYINVKMALVSFVMLPIVTVLTFIFKRLSKKAFQLTRNKITELNTFLSEHISGMKLIQAFVREERKQQELERKLA